MAKGYFNITNSSKVGKELSSSSYIYNLRLGNEGKNDLVTYGFINVPNIYNRVLEDDKDLLLDYFRDLEKYSRKNAHLSIKFICMIPRKFSDVYKNNDLMELYKELGKKLLESLLDELSFEDYKHIGAYAVHNVISSTDGLAQPHLHILISSRAYSNEKLNDDSIDVYDFINSGRCNLRLREKEFYFTSRAIFVNVMNDKLISLGLEPEFDNEPLSKKLDNLNGDKSNLSEDYKNVIDCLKKDYLMNTEDGMLDRRIKISTYNDMEKTYEKYIKAQKLLDVNNSRNNLMNKIKSDDNYLLELMNKRTRLFYKVLNINDNLYIVNNNEKYRSFLLARDVNYGLNMESYLDSDKVVIKMLLDGSYKSYYKLGNMEDNLKKLEKLFIKSKLESYGYSNKNLLDYNIKNVINVGVDIVELSETMTKLTNSKKHMKDVDFVINDSIHKYPLRIIMNSTKIDSRYVNMLYNLMRYDSLINLGLQSRNSDNLIKKVYNGEVLNDLNVDKIVTLSKYIDDRLKIMDVGYNDAVYTLKELEIEIKQEKDPKKIEYLVENFENLKSELQKPEVKNKLRELKNEYIKYVNDVKLVKTDNSYRNKLQNIVSEYVLNYKVSLEENSKISQLLNKYSDNDKIKTLYSKQELDISMFGKAM